ncbi:MAG: hypothetical protein Q4D78_02260 [Neisseria zoodegmatis]|uniref:hypothetical protein n=1 Tax=Neisseria zoodegmatis TaxID=326523 RepID=UPI0026EDA45F|nr:hypothetical protein [Neisseria zoodegmatis]MDO5069011.1 hypothetical protein [Neisseria zoodegmatis]
MKSNHTRTLLALTAASLLAACSSGGKSSLQTMPAPQPPVEKEQPSEQGKPENVQPESEKPQPKPEIPPVKPEAEKPQPKPEVPPVQPEAEKPQPKPEVPPVQPEIDKSDGGVFKRLNLRTFGSGLETDFPFRLVLNEGNRKVDLEIIEPHAFIGQPKIETLRDMEGTLVGYYGYANASAQKEDKSRPQGEQVYAENRHFFMLDTDDVQRQRPAGLADISYTGKMFYQYASSPNRADEARVTATYSGKNKTLSMDIHSDKDGTWRLHGDKSHRSPAAVPVGEDGFAGGHLFLLNKQGEIVPSGRFSGGFYGKNGSVLTGTAGSEDTQNGWQGVIGATADSGK